MLGKLGCVTVSGGNVAPERRAKIVTTIASTITPLIRPNPATIPPDMCNKNPAVRTTANVNSLQILALAKA